jgi:probable F420-dependent oxidoreductase
MNAAPVQRHAVDTERQRPEVNHELGELVAELGAFILPGRIKDPAAGLTEAIEAERAGLGKVWLSERYDLKDVGVLSGAVAALTHRIGFASGLVAAGARHPLVTAAWAATTQAIFGPRLTVGVGRGNGPYLEPQGLRAYSYRETADYADILRRLWRGETVDYDGPLGRFPDMALIDVADVPPPPLILGCFGGPKAMETAVKHFDGVFLMPFLTAEAIAETVRWRDEWAERIGRDPGEVKIIHEMVTAPDYDEDQVYEVVYARALTYLQMADSGEHLQRRNRWSDDDLAHVRAHPMFSGLRTGVADQQFHRSQLVDAARRLPTSWIEPNAAIGTPAQCAAQLRAFMDLGADEICGHERRPLCADGRQDAGDVGRGVRGTVLRRRPYRRVDIHGAPLFRDRGQGADCGATGATRHAARVSGHRAVATPARGEGGRDRHGRRPRALRLRATERLRALGQNFCMVSQTPGYGCDPALRPC